MLRNLAEEFNKNEYISLYKMAELIGRNVKVLKQLRHRKRFLEYINKLPKGMIEEIKLEKKIELDEEYPSLDVVYNLNTVQKFLKENIKKSEALELMNNVYTRLRRLENQYNIPLYELGLTHDLKFYPREIIEKICLPFDINKYMTIYEFAKNKYGKEHSKDKFLRDLKSRIDELPEGMISKKKLDIKYYDFKINREVEEVYLRKDIEAFFINHILKDKVFKELEKEASIYVIRKYYKKLNIKGIILGGNSDVYISKNDYKRLKLICNAVSTKSNISATKTYTELLGYLTLKEVAAVLQLTEVSIKKLIKIKVLNVVDVFGGTKLFDKEAINKIHEQQIRLLQEYKSNYYTFGEIRQKYGKSFSNYVVGSEDKIRRVVNKKEIPAILVGNITYRSKQIYDKYQVEDLWKEYKLYNDMNSLSIDNPFDDFLYKVEHILKVNFKEGQENTKNLWYEYVKKFLYSTKISNKSRLSFLTNQFCRNTEVIFKVFQREIYSYNAYEINNLYLNNKNNICRSYQNAFYLFLKQMIDSFAVKGLPIPFSHKDLTDPRTYKNIKEADSGIYSLEEYHSLYEYVNRIEFHKNKAISDVMRFIKTNDITKYKRYDSCWLYIIVQLTNNWRHSTVLTQIPRVDLSSTQIKNLEWLLTNTPSLEDANNIIFQIGRYVTKINKTGVSAEGIFTVGEPLKIAFATAISICELRKQETLDNNLELINLSGNLVTNMNPHKEFFKEFDKGFKFENRKINRTLTTLIWSVLRHIGKGLKEAQVSRSHLQETTTINHYIKLTDIQVENLVLELFERNQFGFVTQSLNNILFGTELNKYVETERMIYINKGFGNVIKIEATAGLINRLSAEKEQVIGYLKQFKLEDLHQLYYQLLIGILPVKQRHYQCIYSECVFKNELGEMPHCETCSASIINVYALSNIMDNYIYFMKKILKEFDCAPIGEKKKLANHFYFLHSVVDQARKKFGREAVDGFVEGNTEQIKELGRRLESKRLRSYRTEGIDLRGNYSV